MGLYEILRLLLVAGTLRSLLWYTRVTQGIHLAAVEQTEASHRPVLALRFDVRQDGSDEVFEQLETRDIPQAVSLHVSVNGNFLIKNIGNGPALNIAFKFLS